MQKRLMMMLAALMLVGTIFAPAASARSDHAKKSLVALGDSITYGYNLGNNHPPSKAAFPSVMGKIAEMRIRNLGVTGWATKYLLAALKSNKMVRQAVRHADVVTLEIGSTDFLQGLLASLKTRTFCKTIGSAC